MPRSNEDKLSAKFSTNGELQEQTDCFHGTVYSDFEAHVSSKAT